jgi:peptidoglycan/LPS O-acetylase OafA/YrhL
MNSVNRYEYIDSLRGFAIILVLLAHVPHSLASLHLSFPRWLFEISNQGGRGVQLFYIISAFTICMTYTNRIGIEKNIKFNFFIIRFFRIAPLFYICLIYYTLRMCFFDGFGDFNILKLLTSITFTNGFNENFINGIIPGQWSIAIEMVFYLTVPFWIKKINSPNKAILVIFISLIFSKKLILFLTSNHYVEDELFYYFFLPNQISVFFLGVLLYLTGNKNKVVNDHKYIVWANIFFLAFFFVSFAYEGYEFYLPKFFIFSLLLLLLVVIVIKDKSKIIVNKFFVLFGKISFSVYLIHFAFYPLMPLIIKNINDFYTLNVIVIFLIVFVLFIILSGLLSILTYKYIEQPFINIGKKIILRYESN